MSHCKPNLLFSVVILVIFGLAALGPASAQQAPDPQEILRQAQLHMKGVQPLTVKKGIWSYPVREGWHIRQLENRDFGDAGGIDAEFMAKASVHLTRIVRGPDLCDRTQKGVSDLRVIAMQPGAGAFDQAFESRLVVDQESSRAVLFLYGTVREWKPGPEYCGGEKQMVEVGRGGGGGLLRLDLQTHPMGPLTFTGGLRQTDETSEGPAPGFFSWPGGVIELDLQSVAPGAPIAIATAPVSSGSLADALELARTMTGRDDLPDVEEIEAKMPEGMAIDSMPVSLSGQGTATSNSAAGQQEWTLSYVLEIDEEGQEVDRDSLDRRGEGLSR